MKITPDDIMEWSAAVLLASLAALIAGGVGAVFVLMLRAL